MTHMSTILSNGALTNYLAFRVKPDDITSSKLAFLGGTDQQKTQYRRQVVPVEHLNGGQYLALVEEASATHPNRVGEPFQLELGSPWWQAMRLNEALKRKKVAGYSLTITSPPRGSLLAVNIPGGEVGPWPLSRPLPVPAIIALLGK